MTNTKEGAPKTRWGLFAGVLVGIVATLVVLAVTLGFALRTQQNISNQVAHTQPAEQPPQPTPTKYIDYARIVDAIGIGFTDRKTDEEGEAWTNESTFTMLKFIGAPNKLTKISMMFPGFGSPISQEFNFSVLNEIAKVLQVNTKELFDWLIKIDKPTDETRIINGVIVNISRVNIGKGYEWFFVFTVQS